MRLRRFAACFVVTRVLESMWFFIAFVVSSSIEHGVNSPIVDKWEYWTPPDLGYMGVTGVFWYYIGFGYIFASGHCLLRSVEFAESRFGFWIWCIKFLSILRTLRRSDSFHRPAILKSRDRLPLGVTDCLQRNGSLCYLANLSIDWQNLRADLLSHNDEVTSTFNAPQECFRDLFSKRMF
jgi:hypothetical protein